MYAHECVPNKWAVVAEVDETWVTPLDTRMNATGGVVFRRGRGEFLDIQIEPEIAADNLNSSGSKPNINKPLVKRRPS